MKRAGAHKSWVSTIAASLGAAAYLWFVFLPGKRQIAASYDELRSKQVTAAEYGQIVAQARVVQAEFEASQAYVALAQQRLDAAADVSKLYAAIADVAQEAGVRTTRFSPETPQRWQRLQQFPLLIGCRGTYRDVCRTLAGLERLPHCIWVREVTLEQATDDPSQVQGEINLVVFAKNSNKSD